MHHQSRAPSARLKKIHVGIDDGKLHPFGRYELFKWDKSQVPSFEDYVKFVEPKSERNKKSMALEWRKGKNLVTTAGKGLMLQNLFAATDLVVNYRIGSGTTAPDPSDLDCETFISPNITIARKRVSGLDLLLDVYVPSSQNIGTFANGVFCTGSPGVVLSHHLISPSVTHTANDTVTLSYALSIS